MQTQEERRQEIQQLNGELENAKKEIQKLKGEPAESGDIGTIARLENTLKTLRVQLKDEMEQKNIAEEKTKKIEEKLRTEEDLGKTTLEEVTRLRQELDTGKEERHEKEKEKIRKDWKSS